MYSSDALLRLSCWKASAVRGVVGVPQPNSSSAEISPWVGNLLRIGLNKRMALQSRYMPMLARMVVISQGAQRGRMTLSRLWMTMSRLMMMPWCSLP